MDEKAIFRPQNVDVGESPDIEDIVAVFNPNRRDRLVMAMKPLAAVALGQQLQRYGELLLARGEPTPADPFDPRRFLGERTRTGRLDS